MIGICIISRVVVLIQSVGVTINVWIVIFVVVSVGLLIACSCACCHTHSCSCCARSGWGFVVVKANTLLAYAVIGRRVERHILKRDIVGVNGFPVVDGKSQYF